MRHGLGSEHPLCDRIQLLMIVSFFVVWGVDSSSLLIWGYSTVLVHTITYPLLFAGTLVCLCLSYYLVSKSHKAVFEQIEDPPKLVDSGVYAWVRHPMYLGTLLFCLAFLFISASLVSFGILVAFSVFYNRMASYEEQILVEILGDSYIAYKKRVSKWVPGVW